MISINRDTTFKVLKPEAFDRETGVCGYHLWRNTAMKNEPLVHQKGFGPGFYGDFFSSVWAGYDDVKQSLTVYCNSDEDMTWLNFTEDEYADLSDPDDRACAEYTIKFLRDLEREGIIEIQEDLNGN